MILPDFDPSDIVANETGTVAWSYLRPHYERGALFFVDPDLEFQKVSDAFAANDRPQVEAWLKAGDLIKISDLHAAQWEKPAKVMFEAMVISPFVLCRPVPHQPEV